MGSCLTVTEKDDGDPTKKDRKNSIFILILGAGDTGKSTFLRQLRHHHGDGFSETEYEYFAAAIPALCLQNMRKLITGVAKSRGGQIPKSIRRAVEFVRSETILSEESAAAISKLWSSRHVKAAFEERARLKIAISPTAGYLFKHIDRYAAAQYRPTLKDILYCNVKSTGVQEVKLKIENRVFHVIDVAGQRSERRKWLHCFENVSCVIFMASLDEYNLVLEEDETMNRFKESLNLFHTLSGSQFFDKSYWILFLNKSDIFRQKSQKYPLNEFFNDCSQQTASDYQLSISFLKRKFQKKYQAKGPLLVMITSNINSKSTLSVFEYIRSNLVLKALDNAGL
eukprot:TRINITY_DN4456_c0_g1_i1.p1 TRINITY_DN4456_c0_g1~~TRINITY_DN4456_c0_g1_i1.p1  ORF type:complete len:340 (+),score=63.58 TRINITY_DN4456_c0_g1_i1:33-1052(+)